MKKSILILSMFISTIVYGQIPTEELKGEYKFTGGSLTGTTQLTHVGSALTVETDRLSDPSNAISLNGDILRTTGIADTDITISFWVKTSTNDGAKRVIIDQSSRTTSAENSSQIGWYTFLKNGKVGLAANYLYNHWSNTAAGTTGYSGYNDVLSSTTIADGQWHHVTFSAHGYQYSFFNGPYQRYDYFVNYDYKIYIDGIQENAQTVSTPIGSRTGLYWDLTPSGYITFGNSRGLNSTERYLESLDDIRLYGKLLSASEIQVLAREGVCSPPLSVEIVSTGSASGTASWYDDPLSSSWDLAYVATGDNVVNGTTISGIATNNHTITGLTANTTYDVYIRSNCGNTVTDWSPKGTFTTLEGILYVDKSATGANDGSSWADAYTDLQTALPLATGTKPIWVAAGTYTPHVSDRKGTFNIPNNVVLYGGFDGTETNLSERDVKTNVTILSGDLLGNDNDVITDIESTRQDNSYHVVSIRGNAQNIGIDGFTISGGNANGSTSNNCATAAASQYYDTRGGAIYVNPYASSHMLTATVRNCILEKNTGSSVAVFSPFTPCGVLNLAADVDFESCIIRNNYSKELTAMIFSGSSGYTIYGKGSISNSLFYNNTSATAASCLYLGASTANGGNTTGLDFEMVNTTMTKNTGANGNAITMLNAGNSKIRNSIIYGNGSATPFAVTSSGSTVTNSIVEGGQQNGIDSDPLFTDADNDDFTLTCSSPAVDAGSAEGLLLPGNDLSGAARVNTTLDMGAFEFYVVPTAIDVLTQDITVALDATGNYTLTPEEIDNATVVECGAAFEWSLDKTTFSCTDLGANTVTLTATVTNGGAQYSSAATVTVIDNSVQAVAQDIVVQLDATGNATISTSDVNNGSTDNCTSVGELVLSLDKTSFTCADLGVNTVSLTVEDVLGNTATATASVTIEDTIDPVAVAQNVTLQLDENGNATVIPSALDNGSSDNCSGGLTYSLNRTTFSCADVGVNTVTFTATDASGNQSSVPASITVQDVISPTAVARNITVYLDDNGSVTITPASVNNNSFDNCTQAANLTLSIDKSVFTCDDITDLSKSSNNDGGLVIGETAVVIDAPDNTVILTVTDESGNIATATAIVTVLDNIAPVAIAKDITVELDEDGNATVSASDINNGSTDNCTSQSNLTLSLNKTSFSCNSLIVGPSSIKPSSVVIAEPINEAPDNQVILTVTDESGNSSTTTAIVTVEDNLPPVAVAQSITVYLDDNNNATISATEVDNGSYDNCGNVTLSLNVSSFNDINLGENTVILTVQDGHGNSATASAIVTVEEDKLDQTITFNALEDKNFGDPDFDLVATASSSLAVSFEVVSGLATVTGNTLKINGTGSITIRATQSGDADYFAAPDVEQTFNVLKGDQTITINQIPTKITSDIDFDVVASVNSGLELTYSITGPATLSGTTITLDGTVGTVTVTVSQAGNENYNEATESTSFEVAVPASIEDELMGVNIYPNPAYEFINIEATGYESINAGVYDLRGIKILSKSILGENKQLDISNLKTGIYLLKLESNLRSTTTRILIER
ncbi:T9SS type A sorting domain-containing protein [Reichenbachiella sp. MALMAid0571]|uniref:beta strand repeat-containing protein n=1 Tax=Reichenbachiella sp. MALMAid0571 TaxID=3143939 RepID=UPI0032DFB840